MLRKGVSSQGGNENMSLLFVVALIGFGIAFTVQFRLKHHIDREKVMRLRNLADLYPNSIPPRKILTERGRELYWWLYFGMALFTAGVLATVIVEFVGGA